jgi:hypothetical protein
MTALASGANAALSEMRPRDHPGRTIPYLSPVGTCTRARRDRHILAVMDPFGQSHLGLRGQHDLAVNACGQTTGVALVTRRTLTRAFDRDLSINLCNRRTLDRSPAFAAVKIRAREGQPRHPQARVDGRTLRVDANRARLRARTTAIQETQADNRANLRHHQTQQVCHPVSPKRQDQGTHRVAN